MYKKIGIGLAIALSVILHSCQCSTSEDIDVSAIDISITVARFDQDLFAINTDSIEQGIEDMQNAYGEFFSIFTSGIIGIGEPEYDGFAEYLTSFIEDPMVSETNQKVQTTFSDLDALNADLTSAFKRYHFFFPHKQIPAVYGFVSGFNNSVVIADSILGVSFDRYLGRDCEYYSLLGIPMYIQYNMHPKKIASDLVRSWAFGEFIFNDSIDNLLSNMIYEGSLVYLTKQLLPHHSDSLILGFTPSQMKWCKNNEREIWTYLVEHKLLFNTSSLTINQYINDAPFTPNFPRESPGRAAVWLGYRIVSKFMQKNPDYSLADLMYATDYQFILNKSKYKP